MNMHMTTQHLSFTQKTQAYIAKKMAAIADKASALHSDAATARIVAKRQKHTVHSQDHIELEIDIIAPHTHFTAHVSADTVENAMDRAESKLLQQMRKQKDILRSKSRKMKHDIQTLFEYQPQAQQDMHF